MRSAQEYDPDMHAVVYEDAARKVRDKATSES